MCYTEYLFVTICGIFPTTISAQTESFRNIIYYYIKQTENALVVIITNANIDFRTISNQPSILLTIFIIILRSNGS